MSKTLEFFFDVGSPTAYLAWTQLPGLCASTGATLVYRPMLLGGVFQATGNASPAAVPAKSRYMNQDMQRYARRYGVTLNPNPFFPINTLTLMRAAAGLQLRQPERFESYLQTIFKAMWIDQKNLGEPAVLGETLIKAGFDPEQLLALSNAPEVKETLKQTTQEAVERGVFGAPSLFVGDQLFFGQDRLEWVREALSA
jgi:2-hydroxychromene-2-carboxylate isomerase